MDSVTITFPSPIAFSELEKKLKLTSKKFGLKAKSKSTFHETEYGLSWEGPDCEYGSTEILIKKFGIPILRTGIYDKFSNCPAVSQLKLYYKAGFGSKLKSFAEKYAEEFSKE